MIFEIFVDRELQEGTEVYRIFKLYNVFLIKIKTKALIIHDLSNKTFLWPLIFQIFLDR